MRGDRSVEHVLYRGRMEAVPAERRREVRAREWMVIDWFRARFVLREPELAGLLEVLEREGYRSLEPRYVDEDIEDGAHTYYSLTAHGQTHDVSCSNRYPAEIQRIQAYVREHILAPHEAEIAAAPQITLEEARAAEAE